MSKRIIKGCKDGNPTNSVEDDVRVSAVAKEDPLFDFDFGKKPSASASNGSSKVTVEVDTQPDDGESVVLPPKREQKTVSVEWTEPKHLKEKPDDGAPEVVVSVKEEPAKEAPVKEAPAKEAPAKESTAKASSSKSSSSKASSSKSASKKTVVREVEPAAESCLDVGFSCQNGPGQAYKFWDYKAHCWRYTSNIFLAKQVSNGLWEIVYVWYDDGIVHHELSLDDARKYLPI